MRRDSLANANEMAKISSSLRKLLANGSLRQNSLAIANAMAWCTQSRPIPISDFRVPIFGVLGGNEVDMSVRAPLRCKNMSCTSRFCARWWGSCGQQIRANVLEPMKQNASSGARSEAPRRRWKPGRGQHPRPKNQTCSTCWINKVNWQCKCVMFFFPVLKPLTCCRQSRCLGWTYKVPGGQKFSIKLSPLSVGFPQRRPLNLVKDPGL